METTNFHVHLEKEILKDDIPSLVSLLTDANELLKEELNYRTLKSDKPIVFVGDTHGDIETTENVIKKFSKTHLLVFLGDYVDRAPRPQGSIKNVAYVLNHKLKNSDNIILLRGNHEFESTFQRYGFGSELWEVDTGDKALHHFKEVFSNLPYIVTTENGLIALHGGIPNVSSADELLSLPKGLMDYEENTTVLQIVWNDNIYDSKTELGPGGFRGSCRGGDSRFLLYGEPYFSKKMGMFGKKVLVRAHNYFEKGYSLDDKILTIFTSRSYTDKGRLKGNM